MATLAILGCILIVLSLLFTFWWVCNGKQNAKRASSVCWIAVIAGLLLVVADRITEIPTPWGSFKSMAKQAAIEAQEISKIRKEVEAQKQSIDSIAEESGKAKQLSQDAVDKMRIVDDKILTLDDQIQEAKKTLSELKQDVEFTATFNAAQSDDRNAYDQLKNWAIDSTYPFRKRAFKAKGEIYEKHADPMYMSNLSIPWKEGVEHSKFTLKELIAQYREMPDHFKPALIEYIWKREDFPRRERMAFLIDVMTQDASLKAVEYAGRYFNIGADLKYKPLTVEKFLEPVS